jgi:hypothetical protein
MIGPVLPGEVGTGWIGTIKGAFRASSPTAAVRDEQLQEDGVFGSGIDVDAAMHGSLARSLLSRLF